MMASFGKAILSISLCLKLGSAKGLEQYHLRVHLCPPGRGGWRDSDAGSILSRSVVSDSVTPWTVARQAPLHMGFSRQEY